MKRLLLFPENKIQIDSSAYILCALMLLVIPLRWCAAAFGAALFHETCHIMMLSLLRCRIYGLKIHGNGAEILTQPLSPLEEVLAAAAGPTGSFALQFFSGVFPRLAICGFLQGIFNMLPFYPMDGGRITAVFLNTCLRNSNAHTLFTVIEAVTMVGISVFSLSLGLGLLIPAAFLIPIVLAKLEKFLAKRTN